MLDILLRTVMFVGNATSIVTFAVAGFLILFFPEHLGGAVSATLARRAAMLCEPRKVSLGNRSVAGSARLWNVACAAWHRHILKSSQTITKGKKTLRACASLVRTKDSPLRTKACTIVLLDMREGA